ncbi:AAA family ATPase [Phyllobacterium zundukense]|uniref:AAA family ATPase n=1 Tax=Phyllobacterium zundukense TaxID=1867719 RepID=A0ACD4CYW9_9HYPH|nr:AAA family ATPase [Phyllobacterium zundukense]UXN58756.1 AAA family ATPase [Phyllobacterium zundukense]
MLIVFGGLPGTGKTTVARALARQLKAAHIRVDTIEQALRSSGQLDADVGPVGYIVAYAIAEDNLSLGKTVIADSVNPLLITRDAWLSIAERAGVRAAEVEVICSDKIEHRHRVETRHSDVKGLIKPTWQEVIDRNYDDWAGRPIVIDTAAKSVDDVVTELIAKLSAHSS